MARKKHLEEHENHERWLVSYADFITLLFAFFVVMYAISQVNDGKYRVLSDSLIVAFNKPDSPPSSILRSANPPAGSSPPRVIELNVLEKDRLAQLYRQAERERERQAQKMHDTANELRTSLAPLINEGQVHVTESERGIVVDLKTGSLFTVGSATLNPKSSGALEKIAASFNGEGTVIQIEGHTDNVPISSSQFPSNWELSAARAGSVARLFEEQGVVAKRLVAVGFADNRPLESNDTPEGRANNRRVVIRILRDSGSEPATLPVAR